MAGFWRETAKYTASGFSDSAPIPIPTPRRGDDREALRAIWL